jgi:hypothetical protein
MCHYVTATMSAGGDERAVRKIAEAFALRWEQIHNPSVTKALLPGETYFYTTRGMCDCGTDLGSALRRNATLHAPDHEREAKKLRKKGWGAAKIERRIKDRQADFERKKAEAEARGDVPPHHAQIWCDFIHAVFDAGAARSIGILLHFYSGGIDSERIKVGGRRTMPSNSLTAQYLLELDEDVLHEFQGSRRPAARSR